MANITTLDGLETGKYVVTTAHGTRHFVDLDAKTPTRVGAPGRERSDDSIPFSYWTIENATVGKFMRLDRLREWRITSEIQSIKPYVNALHCPEHDCHPSECG
jgi:hypothetical protein